MSNVIEALRHEHRSIQKVLGVLEREIDAFVQLDPADRVDYTLMMSAIDYFGDFPDQLHHPKEDLVFARLRQADPAAAQRVGDLIESHAALAARLRALAATLKSLIQDEMIPRTVFVDQARAFIGHQRHHLATEEEHFFPVAERTLGQEAWAELEKEMEAGPDPLLGGESAERFEALRRTIVSWEATQRSVPYH